MIELAAIDLFESRILPRLHALVRRIRFYVFAGGLADTSAVVLLCFIAQISIDYLFRLRVDLRATRLLDVSAVIGSPVWKRLVRPRTADLKVAEPKDLSARQERDEAILWARARLAAATQHDAASPGG